MGDRDIFITHFFLNFKNFMENIDKEKIIHIINNILKKVFTDTNKIKIIESNDRLNFSCPYCGDSDISNKKRGNLFWNSLHFYCFNGGCNKYKSLLDFIKDFEYEIEIKDKLKIYEYLNNNSNIIHNNYKVLDINNFLYKDLEKYSIDEHELLTKLNLYKINENTKRAYNYLKSRNLHNFLDKIVYNEKRKQLYILNYYKNRIIGIYVRNLIESEHSVRYYILNLEKIHKLLGNEIILDEKINKISVIYNLYNLDYNNPFYIFEGAFDSFFMNNSIALGGLKKDIIDFSDISNANYFYDNDMAGKSQAIEKIKNNQNVFLWSKFINDLELTKYKIKDLNDLVNLSFKHNQNYMNNIKNYFSNNRYDLFYI